MIVLELCDMGSLDQLLLREALQPKNTETISVTTALDIASDVAAGMVYLAELRFVHRDLAARNILMDHHHKSKVSDFGLSKLLDHSKHYYYTKQSARGGPFPLRWSAPEAVANHKNSSATDVWSFGILMYEVISRAVHPFAGCANMEVMVMLTSDDVTVHMREWFPLPFTAAEPIWDRVVFSCWAKAPQQRPTFANLHAIIKQLQSNDYVARKQAAHIHPGPTIAHPGISGTTTTNTNTNTATTRMNDAANGNNVIDIGTIQNTAFLDMLLAKDRPSHQDVGSTNAPAAGRHRVDHGKRPHVASFCRH
jgi:serine/threonine protein kinase